MKSPKQFKVVLVCTGNICRSPMAEGILRHALSPAAGALTEVSSAGVGAIAGLPASEHSITVCADHGIDILPHRSRSLSHRLIEDSDLILTMEEYHRHAAARMMPTCSDRILVLAAYAAGTDQPTDDGVGDPIGGDLAQYRVTYDQIHEQISMALPRLEREILLRTVER